MTITTTARTAPTAVRNLGLANMKEIVLRAYGYDLGLEPQNAQEAKILGLAITMAMDVAAEFPIWELHALQAAVADHLFGSTDGRLVSVDPAGLNALFPPATGDDTVKAVLSRLGLWQRKVRGRIVYANADPDVPILRQVSFAGAVWRNCRLLVPVPTDPAAA